MSSQSPAGFRVEETTLPGVLLIQPQVFEDGRGFFLETWHQERYAAHGMPLPFVQDNHSRSVRRTLRGLHLQREHVQGKLVRVLAGSIYDVAVDVRVGSPCFGRFVGMELTAESFRQIWVPPGFAHGFVVTSDVADVEYKCTDIYHRPSELTILWNDPELAIPWPVDDPILSPKDVAGLPLADAAQRGLLPGYA